MIDENEIIDAEVISETLSESPKSETPKKVRTDDHSGPIDFYGKWSLRLLRFGRIGLFVFTVMGFAFSILFSQGNLLIHLVLLLIGWSMSAISLLAMILGYVFLRRKIFHMKQDPNYEHLFE